MRKIAEYQGNMLNHVEALYRYGERDLVIELAGVLGCAVTDTGIDSRSGETYLAVHPEPLDADVNNNAFYVSPITEEQLLVEDAITAIADRDASLAQHLAGYRDKATRWPFGVPHFGLRYSSEEQIEAVEIRLNKASEELRHRTEIRLFRPGPNSPSEFIQGFLHQDVIVAGSFFLGQLIELQYQRALCPAE